MYSKEDSTSVANIWHPGFGAKLPMCVKYTNLYPRKSFLRPSPGATWVLLLAFPWCRLSSLSQVAQVTAHPRRPSHPVTPLLSCCLLVIPFLLPSKSSSVPFWQHWSSLSHPSLRKQTRCDDVTVVPIFPDSQSCNLHSVVHLFSSPKAHGHLQQDNHHHHQLYVPQTETTITVVTIPTAWPGSATQAQKPEVIHLSIQPGLTCVSYLLYSS